MNHSVLQEPLCAMAWATQPSIPPCCNCNCPTLQEPFFKCIWDQLCFWSQHTEAHVMTWTARVNYGKEKQFISCCSETKGKTARDIILFPFPEGEAFVSDWQWGADTKSLLSLKGMARTYCLNIHFVNTTLNFKVFHPFVSPTESSNKEIMFTSCWPWHCLEWREMCPDVSNLSCNLSIWVWIECPVGLAVGEGSWTIVKSGKTIA